MRLGHGELGGGGGGVPGLFHSATPPGFHVTPTSLDCCPPSLRSSRPVLPTECLVHGSWRRAQRQEPYAHIQLSVAWGGTQRETKASPSLPRTQPGPDGNRTLLGLVHTPPHPPLRPALSHPSKPRRRAGPGQLEPRGDGNMPAE